MLSFTSLLFQSSDLKTYAYSASLILSLVVSVPFHAPFIVFDDEKHNFMMKGNLEPGKINYNFPFYKL